MSSTRTSVSDATAAASWSVAEFIASEPDSSAVLRRMGSAASDTGTPSVSAVARRLRSDTRARYVCDMPRARWLSLPLLALVVALAAGSANAASPEGTTTSYATIGGDPGAPYSRLRLLPGWKRVVRDDLAAPQKRRLFRRRSLLYFAQLSDFQLSDEESPARAEALDIANTPFTSAWRPQEALEPFTVDQVVRQVNRFDSSPLRNRAGATRGWR